MAITDADMQGIAKGIAPVIREQIDRITALEARLAEEEAKALRYGGIFSRGVTYTPSTIVTANGSLWLAIRETVGEKPGKGESWVLISKGR